MVPRFGQRTTLIRIGEAFLVAAVLAIGLAVWSVRQASLTEAMAARDNLATVLAAQASRSVQAVDIVLRDIQERIAARGVTSIEQFEQEVATAEMHRLLRSRADRLPQVGIVGLVSATGHRVNNSLSWPLPPEDLSDRDFMTHFAATDDPNLFISQPVMTRQTHVWAVNLVRRLNGPDGTYLGVVLASIPLKAFEDLFRSINLIENQSFALFHSDGRLVARYPARLDKVGSKPPPDSDWYDRVAKGGGSYESPGVVEPLPRLVSVRPLGDYPLVITVGLSKATALANWRRLAMVVACCTMFGSVGLLLLLHALARQLGRLEEKQTALQASEARQAATAQELETTLASMSQGLLMVDADGSVAVCNPRAIALLDLPAEAMARRPHIETLDALHALADAFAAGPRSFEQTRPDGRIIEVRGTTLAGSGGWLATFDDITARRQAEQRAAFAQAESRAKSGFLAMMSHEIRTPMNGVLGLAGALSETVLTEPQHDMVAAIQDSGQALLRILNDILDFSKLDAGQMQLEELPFAPAALAQDAVHLLGAKAAAKGLAVDVVCEDGLPAALRGDAGRLRQVLLNLVSNAIKFTETGSVTVRIACPERDAHHATVVWTVTDTGIGIAPDQIGGLFGEFFQADASITRRFGGSGLGLAISQRLIVRMGGSVAVRSELGVGSTFEVTLRLPVTDSEIEAVVPLDIADAFQAGLRRFGRPVRILFAEDNTTNQFVARQLLRGFDVKIDMAANGLEAVQAASTLPYDVICMDMRMPEMDGLAATRAIRAKGGWLAAIPIVALTANAFPEDVAACHEAGMTGFVAKPISKKTLLAAILAALERTAAREGRVDAMAAAGS